MSDRYWSRREMLGSLGRTVASALVGPALGAASRIGAAPPDAGAPVIDTHLHLVNLRLPGVPDITAPDQKTALAPFDAGKRPDSAAQLAQAIQEEMKAAGVGQALCMPRQEISDQDPLGIKEVEALAALARGVQLHPVGLAHPERFDRDHLARVEGVLKQGKVKALKAYLGYLRYGSYNPGYRPYYKLAAKYRIPVIFHTGDTFSRQAKVKHAHPLTSAT
jgi:hypothetical protein